MWEAKRRIFFPPSLPPSHLERVPAAVGDDSVPAAEDPEGVVGVVRAAVVLQVAEGAGVHLALEGGGGAGADGGRQGRGEDEDGGGGRHGGGL